MTQDVKFAAPRVSVAEKFHHARAAAANTAVVDEAEGALRDALSGSASIDRILLKAAAGAGKSFALRRLVAHAVKHPACSRVAVVAFTNKQTHALAAPLGEELGRDDVCLFVAAERRSEVPENVLAEVTIATKTPEIPTDCKVVIATCNKLGAWGEKGRQDASLGAAQDGETPYDVLFVDEAWQIPHYLFDGVSKYAPITVGVGDVGQLPPLESGVNPWRGDPGYNPFRAWPTGFDGDERTWTRELPTVWRPSARHLALWRAFYPNWTTLDCVAAPGDRSLKAPRLFGDAAKVWRQVGTGVPTLLEVDGLPEPEAADIDLPLMRFVELLLGKLFAARFELSQADYDGSGTPTGAVTTTGVDASFTDPLVSVLATRNQAVEDAADAVERLRTKHSLPERALVSSTVDSYQGQTNGLTVAIHPLSGASQLDEFNSAFGRLAVTCTRATHGLLVVARPGLDQLLGGAPARPGTPFGEPGNRQLPRQTHQRILATFARGRLSTAATGLTGPRLRRTFPK